MSLFDIRPMVSQVGASALGKTLSIYDVTTASTNEEGDKTPSKESFAIDGVVQTMTAEEDEVKFGLLQTGDIVVWISETETNVSKIKNGNEFLYQGVAYKIKNVINEVGQYEVHAKRF